MIDTPLKLSLPVSTTLRTDNTRDFWQERYETRHTPWDRGEINPALRGWLAEGIIAPPARVMVPGCGRGHEVMAFARRGFDVTGVDLSELALTELDTRLAAESLQVELVEADLLAWTPPAAFDVVYEQTCLCALLPRYWPEYEKRLYEWLRPGGLLMALFMQSEHMDGPPFHCALPDMRDLFDASRWCWPDREPESVPHPGKVFEYAVILRRH
jgi:methyl halide transferase